jgi:prevent-host-death family protein
MGAMDEVSIRDLRNHGGEVIERVARGERLTVTRDGHGVAELRPLGRPATQARVLIERWSRLPQLDPTRLRQDVDLAVDAGL